MAAPNFTSKLEFSFYFEKFSQLSRHFKFCMTFFKSVISFLGSTFYKLSKEGSFNNYQQYSRFALFYYMLYFSLFFLNVKELRLLLCGFLLPRRHLLFTLKWMEFPELSPRPHQRLCFWYLLGDPKQPLDSTYKNTLVTVALQ